MNICTVAEITSAIAVLRDKRKEARRRFDADRVIELTEQIGRLTADAHRIQRGLQYRVQAAQPQEPMR